jgi:predicted type IV restriction endonuclease
MDFADKIAALAQRIAKQKDTIDTEEATKNAFIMPFISALGYDVFDPNIVIPEFTADVGVKKGEKVDYAIKINDKICILIECKPCKTILSTQHMSQLYRYFSVTDARFAILSNGINYWFFTDLEQSNKMDAKPFFEFDMLNNRPSQIEELKKFGISNFDMNSILETASDLKYSSLFIREIFKEIDSPSSEMMKLLIGRVYDGKLTANVLAKFQPLVQKAMKDTLREFVNQRLSSAIDDPSKNISPAGDANIDNEQNDGSEEDGIVTTQEEIDGYQIVRAIVREIVKVDRIFLRDSKSYCAILLDDNNRKPICRLYFGKNKKNLGLFDASKNETKTPIEKLEDIFAFGNQLKETVIAYDKTKQRPEGEISSEPGN